MSSAAYLDFEKPVPLSSWRAFCELNGIAYSPNTVGRNVYYWGGWGGVEVKFGKSSYGDRKQPPDQATAVTVSSFYGSNLRQIAELAGKLLDAFGGTWTADPEVHAHLIVTHEAQKRSPAG